MLIRLLWGTIFITSCLFTLETREGMSVPSEHAMAVINVTLRELRQNTVVLINHTSTPLSLRLFRSTPQLIGPKKTFSVNPDCYIYDWSASLDTRITPVSDFQSPFLRAQRVSPTQVGITNTDAVISQQIFPLVCENMEVPNDEQEYRFLNGLNDYVHEIHLSTPEEEIIYRYHLGFTEGLLKINIFPSDGSLSFIEYAPAEVRCLKPVTTLDRYTQDLRTLSSLYDRIPRGSALVQSTKQQPSRTHARIPCINHRMWLNPNPDSFEAPPVSIQRYIANARYLGPKWQHVFWLCDQTKAPETVRTLQENIPGITISSLSDLTSHGLWPREIFAGLMRENYYTIASNLARIFVLFEKGGVYCDLGCELLNEIEIPFQGYDHIFSLRRQYNSLLEGFIATMPKSPILKNLLHFYRYFPRASYEYMKRVDDRSKGGGVGLMSSEVFPAIIAKYHGVTSFLMTSEGSYYNFNSLRTWMGSGRFGNTGTSSDDRITLERILRYFDINDAVIKNDMHGALLSNYARANCPLVEAINRHFYNIPPAQTNASRKFHQEKAQALYLDEKLPPQDKIPHIMHRIWITDPRKPVEIPLELLDCLTTSHQAMNRTEEAAGPSQPSSSQAWRTILWLNVELPETETWVRTHVPNAEVRYVEEFQRTMRGKEIYETLYGLNRFANASILLRYNVLDRMGGIYADMGSVLKSPLARACDQFDYMLSQRDYYLVENWLDVNFIATKPHAPLWRRFFDFIEHLKDAPLHPDFLKIKRYIPLDEDHAWISGHALSAAMDATLRGDAKTSLLPMCFNSLFHSGSTGSWKNRQFGSAGFRDSTMKFVTLPIVDA